MIKQLNIIFLLGMVFSCSNANLYSQNKAQQLYLENIAVVEKFVMKEWNPKSDGSILDSAVLFLEELTAIQSNYLPGKEMILLPNKENLNDWKRWYKKNKDRLVWDEEELKAWVSKPNYCGKYINDDDKEVINYLEIYEDHTYLHYYKKGNIVLSQKGKWKLSNKSYESIKLFDFCNYNEEGLNFKKFGIYFFIKEGKYLNSGFDGNVRGSFEEK